MKTKDIIEYEDYFNDKIFHNYLKGLTAYRQRDYLSSALEAAVFLEGFLKDLLKVAELSNTTDTLGALVSKLKTFASDNNKEISDTDRALYRDIMYRSDDIKNKRNRIVHENGLDRGDIAADAQDIYENSLKHIIKDYTQTEYAKSIKESKNAHCDKSVKKCPIFISTITPHTFEQEIFIERFCKRLEQIGVTPVRCEFDDYDMDDPLPKVCRVMSDCEAAIVIGINRVHSVHFVDKEGANVSGAKAKEGNHRYYSSAWLQLESGIAVGMGKHIFVLCQKNTFSEGIFDRSCYSYRPIEMDGPLDVNNKKVKLLLSKVKEFAQKWDQKNQDSQKKTDN